MPKFSFPDPPHARLSRRSVLQGAVALGALGYEQMPRRPTSNKRAQ
jgi:hypothetical protein